MTLFFSLLALIGLAQIGLVYITRTSPSDSWPTELAVHNPFWGMGIIALAGIGIACIAITA